MMRCTLNWIVKAKIAFVMELDPRRTRCQNGCLAWKWTVDCSRSKNVQKPGEVFFSTPFPLSNPPPLKREKNAGNGSGLGGNWRGLRKIEKVGLPYWKF